MKTILLITTVFPPQNTIGAQRTYSFAKHLSELGHKVHVITTVKTAIDGDLNYYPDCSMFQLDEFSYLPKKKLSEAPGENSTSEVKKRLSLIKRILRSARRLIFGNLIDVHDPFVFKAFSNLIARINGEGLICLYISRTSLGIGISLSLDISCFINSFGNRASKSLAAIGSLVAGERRGGRVVGRSGTMLYQFLGNSFSSNSYLF